MDVDVIARKVDDLIYARSYLWAFVFEESLGVLEIKVRVVIEIIDVVEINRVLPRVKGHHASAWMPITGNIAIG